MKTSKIWSKTVVFMTSLLLCGCAFVTYVIDPFEQYRESSILPLYDQESYNNPGIAKNYTFDGAILGTSMVEMSMPSVIDECFGTSSVKLPMRGSHISQMGWQMSHVFDRHEMKAVILAVDAYSLMGAPDDMEEIYEYLWNDNPLDDVKYLLNRDVLLVKIPLILKNRGKSLEGKRDAMYQWVDVVFSEESMLKSVHFSAQKDMKPAEERIERSTENIERHLVPCIRAHPETQFYIYMPPYSVAYWYLMTRGGLSEQQFRSRKRVCELLLQYDNVKIFDYSCKSEWTTNLNNYFDYSHHSTEISNLVMESMAKNLNRVYDEEDMERGSKIIRNDVIQFIDEYEK